MRILFFIDSLIGGGRERRLVELLFYLREHTDFELCLVLTENAIDYQYVRDLNISIRIIERRLVKYDPSLFYRFYKIAKEFKPDIIHTWSMMATWYAIPTKLILSKPLLANLIADSKSLSKESFMKRLFFQIDFKFADVILGNSDAGFKTYSLQNSNKTHLIYNGVRPDRFLRAINIEKAKKELNIEASHVILMVASTSKNKNYDLFLDVASYINSRRKDVLFLGVGEGTELDRLKKRIKNEQIENVELIGRREDVEELCALADICLLFTHGEGISNSIIEYMGMGKPVITTDVLGGSKEIIEEGKSGYIMQNNIVDITKRIFELLDNPNLREELGERGKEIILHKFTIKRMGKEFMNLYKKHIRKGK